MPLMSNVSPAMPRHVALGVVLVAVALYAASLFLPAFACPRTAGFLGYEVLLIGWLGVVGLDPRWFANSAFVWVVVATLSSKADRPPLWVIGVAALLALFSFAPSAGCAGGGGAPESSTGLALGGYLWVSALALACVVGFSGLGHASNKERG